MSVTKHGFQRTIKESFLSSMLINNNFPESQEDLGKIINAIDAEIKRVVLTSTFLKKERS